MTQIDVFADVSCPFTHVGLRRLVEHRHRIGRDDVRIIVRAWPLELVNGAPLAADFVAEEIAQIRAQVAPELFTGFRTDRFPRTTLDALRLTHAAYLVGDEVGEAVALELRDRLFERGEDVSDPAVLALVAHDHGVIVGAETDDAVRSEWELGRRKGVIGSPHYFGPGIDMFCPALHIEKDGEHLHIEFDEAAFGAFTDACFV